MDSPIYIVHVGHPQDQWITLHCGIDGVGYPRVVLEYP